MKKKILIDLDVVTTAIWDKKKESLDFIERVKKGEFVVYTPFAMLDTLSSWEHETLKKAIKEFYDVYSTTFLGQSGGARKVNEIQLPANVKGFNLILNLENPRRYPDYTIEILDSKGQVVWQGEGLKRNPLDAFTLTLNRAGLPESRYTIKVYGKAATGSQLLDEYPIAIK